MLTSEERQRIEEEERKQIAEEQYRAEVRAKLRIESAAFTKESPGTRPWTVIFGIVLAGVICLIILANISKGKTGSDSGAAAPGRHKCHGEDPICSSQPENCHGPDHCKSWRLHSIPDHDHTRNG